MNPITIKQFCEAYGLDYDKYDSVLLTPDETIAYLEWNARSKLNRGECPGLTYAEFEEKFADHPTRELAVCMARFKALCKLKQIEVTE